MLWSISRHQAAATPAQQKAADRLSRGSDAAGLRAVNNPCRYPRNAPLNAPSSAPNAANAT